MKLKIFAFVIIGLLFVSSLFFIPRIIVVKNISCQSQFGPCPTSFEEKMKSLLPARYFEMKNKIHKLAKEESEINKYSLKFELPNKLKIDIIQQKPYYAVQFTNAKDGVYLYGQNFIFIHEVESTNLPILISDGDINSDYVLGDEQKFCLEILDRLFSVYGVKHAVNMLDTMSVTITSTKGSVDVIFPTGGDPDYLLGSLEIAQKELNKMIEESRIEKDINQIDLRYKYPILR